MTNLVEPIKIKIKSGGIVPVQHIGKRKRLQPTSECNSVKFSEDTG